MKNGEEIAEELVSFVNVMGHDKEDFVKGVTCCHRTLQQQMFALFAECMRIWGDRANEFYDARNEATVSQCNKLFADNPDFGKVPFI